MGRPVRALIAMLSLLLVPLSAAAEPVQAPHVEVELVADVDSVRPGQPFDAGLRFALESEWHVYWSNPGDSGLAPRVHWTLPEGTEVGELQWPHPYRIAIGPLVNFGYEGEILLPVRVTPPATLAPGETFALAARADWLVCKEDCIPGEAELSLALPVATTPPARSRWAPLFDAMRARLPRERPEIQVEAFRHDERLELRLTAPGGGPVLAGAPPGQVTFFPADPGHVENASEQTQSIARDLVTVSLERARQRREPVERLRGALVALPGFAPDAAPAIAVDVAVRDALPPSGARAAVAEGALATERAAAAGGAVAAAVPGATDATPSSGAAGGSLGLGLALLLAALGGLLLNLMPCVFPVLSIKVLDFVRQASGRPSLLRRHGWAYAAGVLVSFWVLAGLLLALRAGGEALGWGFQLQSPAFVVLMIFLLFALGLSLLGMFDVGVGMTALAGRVPQGDGLAGSFATGVLATVVATPCTAPFMGPALGAALALPAASALLIFTALGAGMALPYVVLCSLPALVRRLPKPGAWLETFKQLMAFPLLGTVVWLVWVLGQQAGVDAILGTLAGLLLLALGLWIRARFGAYGWPLRLRRIAHATALLLAVIGLAVGLVSRGAGAGSTVASGAGGTSSDAYGIPWRDYSAAALAELRAAGTPVFVDFTAAWCLTCKVNEHVVFSSAEVRDAFAAREVAMLRADWTSRDDEITRALASFGRSGVPLYVLYGGATDEPHVLPSVLTRGIVLDALERLG